MLCEMKLRDQLNKGHDYVDVTDAGEVLHMSSYPLLESMGFDTDISDGVAKRRAAALLGYIVCLHQRTKNPLKYVHTLKL